MKTSRYEMLRTEIFYSFIDEVHYTPLCNIDVIQ